MITVHIRKQGGAAIMTIPADVLKMLDIDVGATLELNVTKAGFTARPQTQKRYTLKELLQGTTPKNLRELNKATAWAREGKPHSRELA